VDIVVFCRVHLDFRTGGDLGRVAGGWFEMGGGQGPVQLLGQSSHFSESLRDGLDGSAVAVRGASGCRRASTTENRNTIISLITRNV